jgi:Protein of unknown function (DUF3164)
MEKQESQGLKIMFPSDKPLSEMTDEELDLALSFRAKVKKEQAEKQRIAYEEIKFEIADRLVQGALTFESQLAKFGDTAIAELLEFRDTMDEYGERSKKSKGGYSLETQNGLGKVVLSLRNLKDFDERATTAEGLFRDFFERTLKRTDEAAFDMFINLLEKKKGGKMEYSRALTLLSYEDRYEDESFKKACKLLKESIKDAGTKIYLEFMAKDENNGWRRINTNLSSI